ITPSRSMYQTRTSQYSRPLYSLMATRRHSFGPRGSSSRMSGSRMATSDVAVALHASRLAEPGRDILPAIDDQMAFAAQHSNGAVQRVIADFAFGLEAIQRAPLQRCQDASDLGRIA